MRTNFAGFALAFGMGLIVLLIGFVALSAAGLVSLGPPVEGVAATEMPADTVADDIIVPVSTESRPMDKAGAAAIAGEGLFKSNCSQCHAVNEKVVGPALEYITKRRTVGWIVSWVHNPAKVIASGDDYAVKLFNDNGQQQMPSFPQLSAKEVEAIIAWVEWQTSPTNNTAQTVAAR